MSRCAVCGTNTSFGMGHCKRCWELVNTIGSVEARNRLVAQGETLGDPRRRADAPGLGTFVVVGIPALLVYPLRWLEEATRPPSGLWYFADRASWVFLLCPAALVVMVVMWPRFRPKTKGHACVAFGLTLLTAHVVVMSSGVWFQLLG